MKFDSFTKSLSSLEIVTLVIFIIYVVFPFRTPQFLSGTVNTPIGLIIVLVVTLYLFFYTNPILGVVYIFVAYELLRRSSLAKRGGNDSYMIKYTPDEATRKSNMIKMNPPVSHTLEEEIVSDYGTITRI
jgi:uncharacterized membrane protein (DUF485 family)